MSGKEYSLVHLHIYRKLKEKANGRLSLQCNEALEVLRRNLNHVPHALHHAILKELEEIELIKKENKMRYLIIGGDADRKLRKYYDILSS